MKKSRVYEIDDFLGTKKINMELAPYFYDITRKFTRKEKQMWIAKNRVTGEEYGKTYKSIMDCEDYITKDLKYLNKILKLLEEEKRDLFKTTYNGARIIQCYNKSQKRWADGFDY